MLTTSPGASTTSAETSPTFNGISRILFRRDTDYQENYAENPKTILNIETFGRLEELDLRF